MDTLELKIERLDNKSVNFFRSTEFHSIKPKSRLFEVLKEKTKLSNNEIEGFWNCDEDQNVLIYLGKAELKTFL